MHVPAYSAARLRDGAVMLLVCIGVYLALRPLQNTPFLDDWIYAWRVRWLLDHGQLRALEYSSNPNFVQVLWGALFCLPFGFSFTALRVSTGVLALATAWGEFSLLGELGVSRRDSWFGAAVLCLNPIFFLLALTFMTEVPFLCVFIWAMYLTVRAVHRESDRLLAASIALGCLSAGIRVVGIVLPAAAAMTLLFHPGGWGRRRLRFAWPLVAPALAGAALLLVLGGRAERTIETDQLQALWRILPGILPYVCTCLGLWLLPISSNVFSRSNVARAAACFVPLAVLMTSFMIYRHRTGSFPVDNDTWPIPSNSWPLFRDSFWALGEIGDTEREVPGYSLPGLPVLWAWVVGMVGIASFCGLFTAAWQRRRESSARLLMWIMAGVFFLIAAIGLNFDRYALPLAPPAIALVLSAGPIRRPALAALLIGLMATASLVGARDHLSYNGALWQAVAVLHGRGARDDQIHGGYVVNGWLQRTQPETAPRDASGRLLAPWSNPEDEAAYRYEISNSPRPGTRTLQTIPFTRWFGRSGSIYVLERE
jgi:hypothetical protein